MGISYSQSGAINHYYYVTLFWSLVRGVAEVWCATLFLPGMRQQLLDWGEMLNLVSFPICELCV